MFKKLITAMFVCMLLCFATLGVQAATYNETEPNNFAEDADPLYNGKSTVGKVDADDMDIFYLMLEEDCDLGVVVGSVYGDVYMALYDYDLNCLAVSEYLGEEDGVYMDAIAGSIEAGYYYVAVYTDSETVRDYVISYATLSPCEHKNLTAPIVLEEPTLTKEGKCEWVCRDCEEIVVLPLYAVEIVTEPKTAYAKQGATVKTSVEATGDGLTYTWYIKNAGSTKYSKSSVTGDTYSTTMTDASKGRYVYCEVKDKYGNKVRTKTVVLRMQATITEQPKSAKGFAGTVVTTGISAAGDGLTYTWYIKNPGKTSFSKSSITSAAYSCKMTEAISGRQVYCVVTDQYGKTAKSNIAILSIPAPVKIVSQSKTTYTRQGEYAKATVKAEGDGLTYQWYIKNAGAAKYGLSSVKTANYSVKMSSTAKDRLVYCVVTDKYGNTARTETVRLRMAATITVQPKNVTASNGAIAKTSVTAVGDGLTYTWYIKNPGKTAFSKSSVTAASYSCKMSEAISGRQVYCVVTDKYGKTHKSNTVTLSLPKIYMNKSGTKYHYDPECAGESAYYVTLSYALEMGRTPCSKCVH